LGWASAELGIVFNTKMVSRRGYLSQLVIETNAPILGKPSSPASKLASRAQAEMEKLQGDHTPWQPIVLTAHAEHGIGRKPPYAAFTVQRRVETEFSQNKYYSEAPFPTDLHISLLEQLEADVRAE
jgi:hypothetical protein